MIHLLINMLTIYFVGSQLEPVIKPKKFLIVFGMGVLMTASFASLVLSADHYIGGSLGVFSLIGFLCMGWLKQKIHFSQMGKGEQWIIGLAIFGSLISFDTFIFHSLSFILF